MSGEIVATNIITFKDGILDTNTLFIGNEDTLIMSEAEEFFISKVKKINKKISDTELQIVLNEGVYSGLNTQVIISCPEIS